ADVLAVNLASGGPDHQQIDHDVVVRLVEEVDQTDEHSAAVQRVEIVDHAQNDLVLAAADADSVSSLAITGDAGDDRVTVDAKSFGSRALPTFTFDGGDGKDTLKIDAAADTRWSITGDNAGSTTGAAATSFTNVESLVGAADNQDTFTVSVAG